MIDLFRRSSPTHPPSADAADEMGAVPEPHPRDDPVDPRSSLRLITTIMAPAS
jgi:hypothetical protein